MIFATVNPQQSQLIQMIPFLIIIAIFYFVVFLPSSRAQKKQEADRKTMLGAITKNDEVITSSGIHGTIVSVKDKTFIMRIDDNVKIEIEKSAVSVLSKKHN